MKPKEYVKKYATTFDESQFLVDFSNDFMAQVDYHKTNQWTLAIFKVVVNQMRDKFNRVQFSVPSLSESVWNRFYAKVVCPTRDHHFGAEIAAERRRKEEKRKLDEAMYGSRGGQSWGIPEFDAAFYAEILFGMLGRFRRLAIPTADLETLGLAEDCTAEDVQRSYRKLVVKAHPDAGGSSEEFIRITEAKSRCLQYVESRS